MFMSSRLLVAGIITLYAVLTATAEAAFLEDSKVSLSISHIYMNRDFRDNNGAEGNCEEWGQSLWLTARSGFTEGTVGVGLDALATFGIKLDSGSSRTGTGLLPRHNDGHAADEFSRLGLTGKLKISATELRYGAHVPKLPVVFSSTSRLLPQVYEGMLLTSGEIKGLNITTGRLHRFIERDSTNAVDIPLTNANRRFAGGISADYLDIAGLDYTFSKNLTGRYWYADLDDVYRQHFFSLAEQHGLGSGNLKHDFRVFISRDAGSAKAGKIDNRAISLMSTYSIENHQWALGFQDMHGDTAMPYVGRDPQVANLVQLNTFVEADERSWQARYDYNFAAFGMPCLSFLTRYIRGTGAKSNAAVVRGNREWERNATLLSDFARDADETRVIISYSWSIW